MNNFSIIGNFVKLDNIDGNVIYISSTSPLNKKILIPITFSGEQIFRINENDLLGIHGFIECEKNSIKLVASKIIWLSEKK